MSISSASGSTLISPTASSRFGKFFFGTSEILIPLYRSTDDAAAAHPDSDVLLNFASFRRAYRITSEKLARKIRPVAGLIIKK